MFALGGIMNRASAPLAMAVLMAVGVFLTAPLQAQQVWSPLVHVSQEATSARLVNVEPRAAVDEAGNVAAVWLRRLADGQATDPQWSVAVSSSFDGGASFGPAADLASLSGKDILAADVVYAGSNTWLCLFVAATDVDGIREVYLKKSANNGLTWSDAVVLYNGPLDVEIDIATDKTGTVIATFNTRLLRSTDFGITWEPMTEPLPIPPLFPSNSRGYLESRIGTNGGGIWIHAYTSYEGTFDRFVQTFGAVSTDNGATWNRTLSHLVLSQQQSVLGDVALMGDTAVVAFQYGPNVGVFVSANGGQDWTGPQVAAPADFPGYASNISVAAANGEWTLLARNLQTNHVQSFVTPDPLNWGAGQNITTDTAVEAGAVAAVLPGGNVVALLETNRNADGAAGAESGIYATIRDAGGLIPPPAAGPDLVLSSIKAPSTKARIGKPGKTKWTVAVTNVGEQDSQPASVRFYLSADDFLDNNDVLVGEKLVKPIKAAKPGKKLKSKKVKLNKKSERVEFLFVIAELVYPENPVSLDNVLAGRLEVK